MTTSITEIKKRENQQTEYHKAWSIDDEINQDRKEIEYGPTASLHRIAWELQWDGTITATIHCRAASQAPCRLHCPYNHVNCACPTTELDSKRECLAVEWFNATDATDCYQPAQEALTKPRDGAVTVSWDSTIESWIWHYPNQGATR